MTRGRILFWLAFILLLLVPFAVMHRNLNRLAEMTEGRRPGLLLVVTLDTTRLDRLGFGGLARARTPVLDDLSRRGVTFPRTWCQIPITNPSHCTIFTGLEPHTHGVLTNGYPMDSEIETLAEIVRSLGYRTGAFLSGFSLVDRISGLAQGFDEYDDRWSGRQVERTAGETTRAALAWIRDLGPEERAFLWVHYFDPHHPYQPEEPYDRLHPAPPAPEPAIPAEVKERYEEITDRAREGEFYMVISKDPMTTVTDPETLQRSLAGYDGELARMDAALGDLLTGLAVQGRLEDALIAVVGDHGEGFELDYYYAHGDRLYESALAVPMMILRTGPKALASRLVPHPVGTVDLMPSLLRLIGVTGRGEGKDRDLLARQSATDSAAARTFARSPDLGRAGLSRGAMTAVRGHDWKLVHELEEDRWILTDLERDPAEQQNLWGSTSPRVGFAWRGFLRNWEGEALREEPPADLELDQEARESLQALGYLQ